ncbi:MAG: guanylate kinase [Clostridia bacterium]|nr:guanylate kinase [Clostridia bacterium]
MGKKGTLYLVSGFSGVGKNTVLNIVLEKMPDLHFSVSCTSRAPREGEKDGVNYFFISEKEFEEKIAAGQFVEYTKTFTNYYGTLKSEVEGYVDKGIDVILEINVVGTKNVKAMYDNAVSIFVAPPSLDELKNRLLGRGTETEDSIKRRLAEIEFESKEMEKYDFIVINEIAESCADMIMQIIKDRK